MSRKLEIRKYKEKDCLETYKLFYDTVHYINSKDYSFDQINVWAPRNRDLKAWNESFMNHSSLVALINNQIVGFADIDDTGYLDRLYVHHKYQHQGIATSLCDLLEEIPQNNITTYASITAKPFFEKRGYQVIREQRNLRENVILINYLMIKYIC